MIDPRVFQMMLGNNQQMGQFQQQFQAFQNQFQGGPTPNFQRMVMQNLSNGTMSQEQFEQCRRMANQLTGKNY